MDNNFYTQASNFMDSVRGGVDPRTGLFNIRLPLSELVGNDRQGPTMNLALSYSPTQQINQGYGIGFSLNYSFYDTNNHQLVLSNGERYKVMDDAGLQPVIRQKKTEHFRFERSDSAYRIIWKNGLVEILAGPRTADKIKLPLKLLSPLGHALTLKWDYSTVPPRLTSVTDDRSTVLLNIVYTGNIKTSLHFWPNIPDAYDLTLQFTNSYLTEVKIDELTTTLRYATVGTGTGALYLIDQIVHPTRLIETVQYQASRMKFPDGAKLPALPVVAKYTLDPGSGQAQIIKTYQYSDQNYLAYGSAMSWQADMDNLYGVVTLYKYWSKETLVTGGVTTSTTRTYNNFHLMVEEKTECGQYTTLRQTTYYAVIGDSFEKQPTTFQLPKQQIITWRDDTKPDGQKTRQETTATSFDTSGNLTKQVNPDGTTTEYVYFPSTGETGSCPAEPNGFTRLVKNMTVTAASSAFTVPNKVVEYTYKSFSVRSGSSLSSAVVPSSETHFSGSTKLLGITRDYVDSATSVEHGRLKVESSTYYQSATVTYVSKQTFAFTTQDQSVDHKHTLFQSVVTTTHDQLSVTQQREQSRYTGRLLATTDPQGLRTAYAYDALGRLRSETRNVDTDYQNVTKYTYALTNDNVAGVFLTQEDASGNPLKTSFDGLGQPVKQWRLDLDGTKSWRLVQTRSNDAAGRLAQISDYDWLDSTAQTAQITRT